MSVHRELRIDKLGGKGRPVCVLVDQSLQSVSPDFTAQIGLFCDSLCSQARVYKISASAIDYRKVDSTLKELTDFFEQEKVRQAGFIVFGSCTVLLWKLAILSQKYIRYALVVNGESRPEPSVKERLSDWLERNLPLGLPFRIAEGDFHALPFLQRFRFPVFVVVTDFASTRLQEEAKLLGQELPVAWTRGLSRERGIEEQLSELFYQLQSVPAKCPQKKRKAA